MPQRPKGNRVTVYEMRDGRARPWRVDLRGPLAEAAGKHKLVEHFATKHAALRRAARLRDELNIVELGHTTLDDAIELYVKHGRAKGWKDSTCTLVQDRVRPLTRKCEGLSVDDIRRRHIVERLDRIGSVAARRRTLGDISRFFAWAREHGYCAINPCDGLKVEGREARGKAALSRREARALDAALEGAWAAGGTDREDALFVALLLYLGIRRGEALQLQVGDIDIESAPPVLQVRQETKTDTSVRDVEVHGRLASWLQDWTKGRPMDDPVFASKRSRSGRREGKWAVEAVARMCRRAGAPVVTPHGLRDTHAQLDREAGTAAHRIAQQLGHASATVTQRHYIGEEADSRGRRGRVLGVLEGGGAAALSDHASK